MKKNITINLYGALYAIDEDAYALLERYLENMKRYFSRAEGGDEIADDVEHRVAELFAELREQGVEAINIDHVSSIIQRIGNPEEMTEDDAAVSEADKQGEEDPAAADDWQTEKGASAAHDAAAGLPPTPPQTDTAQNMKAKTGAWMGGRKLYRDTEDKLLGGVMSGLCHYFGGTDPLPWRLLMVLLLFLSFSAVGILYLLAWAIVPAARTDEERLRMCGRPVTPQNINEEMLRRTQQQPVAPVSMRGNGLRTFFYTFVRIVVLLVKIFILLVAIATFIGLLIFFFGFLFAVCSDGTALVGSHTLSQIEYNALLHNPHIVWEIFASLLFAFLALIIVIGSIIYSLARRADSTPMSTTKRITLIVLFLLSAAASITFCAVGAIQLDNANDVEERRMYTDAQGLFISPDSRSFLEREGWTVEVAENCNENGEWYAKTYYFDEDGYGIPYLAMNRGDETKPMRFCVTKSVQLPAGYYRLEAITRCDSKNVCIGYWDADSTLHATNCPSYDVKGEGNLQQMDYEWAKSTKLFNVSLSMRDWEIKVKKDVADWSYVTSELFYFPGGTLRYGFMNDKDMKSGNNASSEDILRLEVVPAAAAISAPSAAPAIKVQADTAKAAAHK